MAIIGVKEVPVELVPEQSPAEEAAEISLKLLMRLELVNDEKAALDSLRGDFARCTELGQGRLYLDLPAGVTFEQLLGLANELAEEKGFDRAFRWPSFWVPRTERESVTAQELNGNTIGYSARVALFAPDSTSVDPLLHFTGLSFDEKYRVRKQPTQLEKLAKAQTEFAQVYSGASLRAADHRDFLVWYIMDMLRDVSAAQVVLAKGFMRVPALGRRTVGGDSCVGDVRSYGDRAYFDGSNGVAFDGGGVGLSAGFNA